MTWACPRCLEDIQRGTSGECDRVNLPHHEEVQMSRVSQEVEEKSDKLDMSGKHKNEEEEVPNTVQEETSKPDLPRRSQEVTQKLEEDPLSVTAQLEALHEEECGVEAGSFLFTMPSLPMARPKPREIVELDCLPGKKYRRSMAVEQIKFSQKTQTPKRKTSRVSFMVIPTTPKVRPNQVIEKISESPEVDQAEEEQEKSRHGARQSLALDSRKSLSQLLLNLSLTEGPAVPDESPLPRLLELCTTSEVVNFHNIYDVKTLASSSKLGEGAFGEVFGIGPARPDMPVLKVVPIGGTVLVNGFEQTTLEDISSEVLISSYLSGLRCGGADSCAGFVELRSCYVFKGEYPARLLELWDEFEDRKGSENDRPDVFQSDQLYIALEYGNGGKDLEKFVFQHPLQAYHAWNQVAHTLAVAEQSLQFEHRDLHWGNVLVKECTDKTTAFTIQGETFMVETGGTRTQIIDFSLSRLQDKEGIVFKDLSQDPDLFLGKGLDKGGDYQFDCYRNIRENNQDAWNTFCPKSNIFWLHYTVRKMINGVNYRKKTKKNTKHFSRGLSKLKFVEKNILKYNSAREYVWNV